MPSIAGVMAVRNFAGSFRRWWLGELTALVPGAMKRALIKRRTKLVLDLQDGEGAPAVRLSTEIWRGGRLVRRQVLERNALTLVAARDVLATLPKRTRQAPLVLRIPAAHCLVRTVWLPGSARPQLAGILDLDIERVTPFERAEVYSAHVADPRPANDGKLRVTQIIVERSRVDPVLAQLGLAVTALECWDKAGTAPLPVDLLGSRRPAPKRGGGLTIGLALTVLVMGAGVVWLDFDRYGRAIDAIDAKLAVARNDLADVRKLRAGEDAAHANAAALLARKQQRHSTVDLIEDISRRMPDDSWLTSLRIEGHTADLFGFAKSATALAAGLGSKAVQTRLTAPITFDTTRKAEQFSLRWSMTPLRRTWQPMPGHRQLRPRNRRSFQRCFREQSAGCRPSRCWSWAWPRRSCWLAGRCSSGTINWEMTSPPAALSWPD